MGIELNKTYIIRVIISNQTLTYHATILSEDEDFITFKDKFGKIQRYNKNVIGNIEGPIN